MNVEELSWHSHSIAGDDFELLTLLLLPSEYKGPWQACSTTQGLHSTEDRTAGFQHERQTLHHLSCLPGLVFPTWVWNDPLPCTSLPPMHLLLLENHSSSLQLRACSLPLHWQSEAETLEFYSEGSSWAMPTYLSGSSCSPGAHRMDAGEGTSCCKVHLWGHNLFSLHH